MQVINLRLMSHPINWIFVWVVLALASMAFHAVHDGVVSARARSDNAISPD